MPRILNPELQSPLLYHGLVHLYSPEISAVYGACVVLRDTIKGDRDWLDGNCRHVLPHSYGDHPAVINTEGDQKWFKDGKLHRDGDHPAVINTEGDQKWFKDGKLHRDGDFPAAIRGNGTHIWYRDGKQHRDGDLPAEIRVSGTQAWYRDGKCHRDGDLPAWIWADGEHEWYQEGELQTRVSVLYKYGRRCLTFFENLFSQ